MEFKVAKLSDISELSFVDRRSRIERKSAFHTVHVGIDQPLVVHPQQSVLASTLEYVRVPKDLSGEVHARSTIARTGLSVEPAIIHPGFSGAITLRIRNLGHVPLKIKPGTRIAQLTLGMLIGEVDSDESRYKYSIGPTESSFGPEYHDLSRFHGNSNRLVIGVVSTRGSGRKTLLRAIEEEFGFEIYSLGEFVRQETAARSLGFTDWKTLQDVGNECRRLYGADYFAKQCLHDLDSRRVDWNRVIVVHGFRNIAEIDFFKKNCDFYAIAIDADQRLRYERRKLKGRHNEAEMTWDEFKLRDDKDLGYNEPEFGQQLRSLLAAANQQILNETTVPEFEASIIQAINSFVKPGGYR